MRNQRSLFLSLIVAFLFSSIAVFGQQKAPAAAAPVKAAKAAPVGDLLDINTAAKADMVKTLGVTDDDAQKIVAGRPYQMKTQLKSRNIVPEATYAKIADKIIAKQAPKKK